MTPLVLDHSNKQRDAFSSKIAQLAAGGEENRMPLTGIS